MTDDEEPEVEPEGVDPIPIGFDEASVREWVYLLRHDPRSRLVAEIARRSGRPFGQVDREFLTDDLHVEIALSRVQSMERVDRCGQCGTAPSEFEDERGRPVENPLWELHSWVCEACAAADEEVGHVPEKDRKHFRTVWRPRTIG